MPRTFLYLLVLGLWPFLVPEARAQTTINQLPAVAAQQPRLLIGEYMVDSTDRLTIEQVTHRPLRWQPMVEPTLVLGFTPHPVWCRLTLQQPTPAPRTYALELTNFYVDSLSLYQPDSLRGWHTQFAGDGIPYARRTPRTRYPTLYVTLPATAPQTLYARIVSTQHHNYAWRAWDRATFDTVRLPDVDRYVMFTLATMLALFELMLLLFMHPYGVLRAYALSSLVVCLSVLFGAGYPGIYFPHSPYWANTSHYMAVGLVMPAVAYYITVAFRLAQLRPRLVWLYRGFGALGVLYAGLSLVVRHAYLTWAFITVLAIMYGFTLLLFWFLLLRKQQPVLWNIPAMLIALPVYTYYYGRNAGFFPGSVSEEAITQVMFISFACEPLFVVLILWHTTREGIRTAARLSVEQAQREAILAMDTLKTTFFANVSHELRTPLTLILGPLGSLLKQPPADERSGELLRTAHQNARRLLDLVNEIMDLTKLDAGKLEVAHEPVLLRGLVERIVANFEVLARQSEIYLQLVYKADPTLILDLDGNKFQKILDNLLINALKFTPSGGSIIVTVTDRAGRIQLAVRDTGRGIYPDDLPYVFDRYVQSRQPGAPSEGGTGIGLALSAELATLLGGTLRVESEWQQGTTFFLEIPGRRVEPGIVTLIPDTETEAAGLNDTGPLIPLPVHPNRQKTTLLLVEDDSSLRHYLTAILQPNFTVLATPNGQEALNRLATLSTLPSLIISDLMMPLLDGFQLLETLKQSDTYRHIPVVMLTARADEADKLQALRLGVDDYLLKPFDEDELMARVLNLLTNVQHRQPPTSSDGAATEAMKPVPLLSSGDMDWLKRLEGQAQAQLSQFELTADQLAAAMSVSRSTLFREVRRLTGLTPAQYITEARLQQARHLLENRRVSSVKEVGLRQVKRFSAAFKSRFGKLPSDYL
ncbi:response regulator [Spirosoma validum]|uniref:histidine kinase n=1 Tax=Spirosoma validum TaxID=2771355 RepID=A0A927B998_9BACT|nr:response regulator [Spirosoma validum]MBD2757709.1 response regulator [Spirosoma validum]